MGVATQSESEHAGVVNFNAMRAASVEPKDKGTHKAAGTQGRGSPIPQKT